jgi:hypothetical protein
MALVAGYGVAGGSRNGVGGMSNPSGSTPGSQHAQHRPAQQQGSAGAQSSSQPGSPEDALIPFLHRHAAHFWHELCSFAASPYTIQTYDRLVQYASETRSAGRQHSSSTPSDHRGRGTLMPRAGPMAVPAWHTAEASLRAMPIALGGQGRAAEASEVLRQGERREELPQSHARARRRSSERGGGSSDHCDRSRRHRRGSSSSPKAERSPERGHHARYAGRSGASGRRPRGGAREGQRSRSTSVEPWEQRIPAGDEDWTEDGAQGQRWNMWQLGDEV